MSINFINEIKGLFMLKGYSSNRISRTSYFFRHIICFLILLLVVFIDFVLSPAPIILGLPSHLFYKWSYFSFSKLNSWEYVLEMVPVFFLSSLYVQALIFSSIMVINISVKRLHDIGLSGWWYLLVIILDVFFVYIDISASDYLSKYEILYDMLSSLMTVLSLASFFVIGLTKGDPNPNKYGNPV